MRRTPEQTSSYAADRAWTISESVNRAARHLASGDPLLGLAELDFIPAWLEELTDVLATAARVQGATWQEIADALGLKSRQAAEQRYGPQTGQ